MVLVNLQNKLLKNNLMTKHLFITILLLSFFFKYSISQIVYNDTNFANPSDSFIVSKAIENQLNNYDFSQTGTNYNWNFSGIGINTQLNKRYINPDFSGYKMTWITNCIAGGSNGIICNNEWNDTTNLAEFIPDSVAIGSIYLSDVAYFYKKNQNVLENSFYAYSISANGLNIKKIVNYDNIDTIYHFPLQYQNIDSAIMEVTTDLNSIGIDVISKKHQKE